jgi:hypothetical protein
LSLAYKAFLISTRLARCAAPDRSPTRRVGQRERRGARARRALAEILAALAKENASISCCFPPCV